MDPCHPPTVHLLQLLDFLSTQIWRHRFLILLEHLLYNCLVWNDHLQTERSPPITGADGRFVGSVLSGALDKPDTKIKPDAVIDSSELAESESPKLNDSVASVVDVDIEKDDCPICLEEYVVENPRITTRCVHHFHLSCILEWMERSDICPICNLVIELFDD